MLGCGDPWNLVRGSRREHVRLDAWVMTPIAAALAIAGVWRARRTPLRISTNDLAPKGSIDRVLAALIVLVSGLAFVGTLTPEVRHDPLFYHVEVPRLWLNFGRMVEIPENGHSYFPYGFEMLYAWALSLGSDSAAKALHWAAGLAAAGMTGKARACDRRTSAARRRGVLLRADDHVSFNDDVHRSRDGDVRDRRGGAADRGKRDARHGGAFWNFARVRDVDEVHRVAAARRAARPRIRMDASTQSDCCDHRGGVCTRTDSAVDGFAISCTSATRLRHCS